MADKPFSSHGAGVKLQINGLDAMVKGFTDAMSMHHYTPLVKEYTTKLASTTHRLMNQQYKGHYEWSKYKHGLKFVHPTGTTRRSTQAQFKDDGKTGIVAPQTSYFPYLEYGTRKMKARPTLGPAFEIRSKQFEKALDERFATWARHKHF